MGVTQSRREETAAGQHKGCDKDRSSKRRGKSAGMSSNNNNRRFRFIIPRRSTASGRKSQMDTKNHHKPDQNSTPTPSPIVAAFMTNISSRGKPIGRGDGGGGPSSVTSFLTSSTVLPLVDSDENIGSMHWPSSSIKKRQGSKRLAAGLDIPSPVPSVSEPSEDSASVEDESASSMDGAKADEGNEWRKPNGIPPEPVKNDPTSGCCAKTVKSKPDATDVYVAADYATVMVQPEQDGPCRKMETSESDRVERRRTVVTEQKEQDEQQSQSVVPCDPIGTPTQVKRPNWLSSFTTVSAIPKGRAPLAESECFVIENSPAVEIPHTSLESQSKLDGSEGKNGTAWVGAERRGVSWRLQSRLKDPGAYASRQQAIYNRSHNTGDTVGGSGNARSSCCLPASTATSLDTSKVALERASPVSMIKHELHDSSIKMDSVDGSSDAIGCGNNKTCASPEGSIHRGLIDDEIRDQPDLTIGCSSSERLDDPTEMGSLNEEHIVKSTTGNFGGPVRLRDKIRERSTGGRKLRSFCSTASSISVDSGDLMVDYEESEEDGDAGWAYDSGNACSSLGRCRSPKKTTGGGSGSWGRRSRMGSVSSTKQSTLRAVVNEWSSLKGRLDKSTSVSEPVQEDSVDNGSSAGTAPGRIFKRPASLELPGLPQVAWENQTYRRVVQDVTVVKTLLLRLKRVLQEAETSNPFEIPTSIKNGTASILALSESHSQKLENGTVNEALQEENCALRTQLAIMSQRLEDQNKMIACLQYQLNQCRQRNMRKWENSMEDECVSKGTSMPMRNDTSQTAL